MIIFVRICMLLLDSPVTGVRYADSCAGGTRYRTRHFFNNFTSNEDIATKFEADLPHYLRNVTTS